MRKMKEIATECRIFLTKYSYRQVLPQILKNISIIVLLSYLFYDHFAYCLLLFPGAVILMWQDAKRVKAKNNELCRKQFQDMLSVLSQDLQAGNSIENAFIHSEKELSRLYTAGSVFMNALRQLVYGLRMNLPIERLVSAMAEETNQQEIRSFSLIFKTVRRSGGNMVETIAFSADTLIEKIRLNREMENIISAKRMEQRIMSVIPMVVLFYVKLCCGDFLKVLYRNLPGNIIMSCFLLIYAAAYIWSDAIVDIKV